MADQSSSSNAAPAVNPQVVAPEQTASTTAQVPGMQPATSQGTTTVPDSQNNEPKPSGFSFETHLSDDEKNYLKAQGIDKFDEEGIKKIIHAHKDLRAKKNEPQGIADAVSQAMGIQPTQAINQAPVGSQEPQQQAQTQLPSQDQNQAQPTQLKMPNEWELASMGNYLKTQYPDVGDVAQVFKEMGDFGVSPVSPDGTFNFNAITRFAQRQNDFNKTQRELAEVSKPQNTIPDVIHQQVDHNQPQVQTMDLNAAQNIIMHSQKAQKMGQPVHPQYEEATAFFKANAFSSKK